MILGSDPQTMLPSTRVRGTKERDSRQPTHLEIATDKREPQGRGHNSIWEWGINKAAKVRRNADPGVVNGRLGLKH